MNNGKINFKKKVTEEGVDFKSVATQLVDVKSTIQIQIQTQSPCLHSSHMLHSKEACDNEQHRSLIFPRASSVWKLGNLHLGVVNSCAQIEKTQAADQAHFP